MHNRVNNTALCLNRYKIVNIPMELEYLEKTEFNPGYFIRLIPLISLIKAKIQLISLINDIDEIRMCRYQVVI